MSDNYHLVKAKLDKADHIVIIQADNPDGDSLSSALALEDILENIGKSVTLYCGVEIPTYLRYMSGWDRVISELPNKFDLSIVVDTASITLLETMDKQGLINLVATKPCIVIDHHETAITIPFASVTINEKAVSTGEVIYRIASNLGFDVSLEASEFITYSILSDSLGMTSEAVTSDAIHLVGKFVENGVSLAKLDNARKQLQKKSQHIVRYKGQLLSRIEFSDDGRIATVHIPWKEIEKYSHEYNPSILVIDDMRMVQDVCIAVAFKSYPDGKITAKIRANYGFAIASTLAVHFGGGGHTYAAGFKVSDGRSLEELQKECIIKTKQLLDEIDQNEAQDETI